MLCTPPRNSLLRLATRTPLTTIDWSSQGHDTTSVGICWALFLIGLHDEAQERIFSELTEIFGTDNDRVATYQDLNEMKYLERVLKESLRLYPSVPNISRKMSEDIEIGEAFAGLRSLCEALPAGNIEKENFHELYDSHSHKFPKIPEFDTLCYISVFFVVVSPLKADIKYRQARSYLFKFILFIEMKGNFNTIHLCSSEGNADTWVVICDSFYSRGSPLRFTFTHFRYFEDPEKFDPDRFLPENIEERQRLGRAAAYSYVPFAGEWKTRGRADEGAFGAISRPRIPNPLVQSAFRLYLFRWLRKQWTFFNFFVLIHPPAPAFRSRPEELYRAAICIARREIHHLRHHPQIQD